MLSCTQSSWRRLIPGSDCRSGAKKSSSFSISRSSSGKRASRRGLSTRRQHSANRPVPDMVGDYKDSIGLDERGDVRQKLFGVLLAAEHAFAEDDIELRVAAEGADLAVLAFHAVGGKQAAVDFFVDGADRCRVAVDQKVGFRQAGCDINRVIAGSGTEIQNPDVAECRGMQA